MLSLIHISPLSFLADAGHGHFDISDELIDYLSLFLKKAVEYRLPKHSSSDIPVQLIPVEAKNLSLIHISGKVRRMSRFMRMLAILTGLRRIIPIIVIMVW